jgi:hypothetical protein
MKSGKRTPPQQKNKGDQPANRPPTHTQADTTSPLPHHRPKPRTTAEQTDTGQTLASPPQHHDKGACHLVTSPPTTTNETSSRFPPAALTPPRTRYGPSETDLMPDGAQAGIQVFRL